MRAYKKFGGTSLPVGGPYGQVVKLRYAQEIELNPGVGGLNDYNVYRLNGMYDPDQTGVGAQPRGFDQYVATDGGAGLFHHYTVLGARCKAMLMNKDTSYPVLAGLAIRDTSSPVSSLLPFVEQSNNRLAMLSSAGSGGANKTLTINWSAKRWFGKTSVTTERDLTGNSGANPPEEAFIHLFVNGLSQDTSATTCLFIIDYIVLFRNKVVPGAS
jgi:hypothetical protein